MTVVEGFELGVLFSALLFWGWYKHSPALLYLFAAVAGLAEIASMTMFQPAREAPYAWIFVLGLAGAGFMLSRAR